MRGLLFVTPDYWTKRTKKPRIARGDSRRAIIHNAVINRINTALRDMGLTWDELTTDYKADVIACGLDLETLAKVKNNMLLVYTLPLLTRLSWLCQVSIDDLVILDKMPPGDIRGLRAIREAKNLTQKRLAKLCRINQRYISEIETAKKTNTPPATVSVETIAILRDYLQLPIDDILGLENPLIRKNTEF